MSWFTSRALGLAVASLGIAAALGGSLGIALAGTRPALVAGVNPTVGGPLRDSVAPQKFMSCLPAASWNAIYIWDAPNQKWLHYFNTANGVPSYVNDSQVGGIINIPRFSGVAVIMNQSVSNPFLPDSSTEACPAP